MTKFFRFKEWVKYQIIADNAYSLHSPFLYQFWENIIKPARKDTLFYTDILPVLQSLYADNTFLEKKDLGTGKSVGRERVQYVAKTSSVRPRYGHILHQIVRYFNPRVVLELGTCLGISTRYLLNSFQGSHFYSIEGSPERHAVAQTHLKDKNRGNIFLIQDSFENALPDILAGHSSIDLAFIDGNHTFQSTGQYFSVLLPYLNANSILVFDDIHWSEGMLNAWKEICQNLQVSLTIDLFQFGICFFNPDLSKQNKILRY